jgi:hypothetical protein
MPPKKTPTKKLALNKSLGELRISSNQPELGYLYGRGSIGARFYNNVRNLTLVRRCMENLPSKKYTETFYRKSII